MKAEMVSKVVLGFVFSILMLSGLVVAQGLQDVINLAKDVGVFQFYLPFILVFAILYGLLARAKIFGQGNAINVVIALAASGFIMVYTPVGITFSEFLTRFVGNVMVIVLTLLAVLMFATLAGTRGVFSVGEFFKSGWGMWSVIIILLLLVIGVFVASGGTSIFPGLDIGNSRLFDRLFGIDNTLLALIILVLGTGLVIFFFSRGGGETKPAGGGGGT